MGFLHLSDALGLATLVVVIDTSMGVTCESLGIHVSMIVSCRSYCP